MPRREQSLFLTQNENIDSLSRQIADVVLRNTLRVFANAAARDAFFNTPGNTAFLFTGISLVLLEDNGMGSPLEQVWNGPDQPDTYLNTDWVDRASGGLIDAATIKTLYESNADTNAFTDAFLAVLQRLRFENNRIISDVTIETPTGSLAIGESTVISTALRTLNIRSDITSQHKLVLTQQYDEASGLAEPFIYAGGAMTQVPINDPPGTDVSNSAQFSLTATADEIITQFSVETNQVSQSIPFVLTGRATSHSGPVLFNFNGNATTDASGIAVINLFADFNPIIVDNGDQVFITATATGLVGVQSGPDFTPNTTINRIIISRTPIATFNQEIVEVTGTLTISDANLETYNRKLIVVPSSVMSGFTITIAESLQFDFLDFYNNANVGVLVAASGADRISGETDIRFTEFEGGRFRRMESTSIGVVFDNIEESVIDNYVDTVSLVNGSTLRLGRTGALGNLDLNLNVLAFEQSFIYNPSGNQDLGVDLTSDIHIFGSNTTSITILNGTTLTTNRYFQFVIQGASDVTFNLATSGFVFAGAESGTSYSIPAQSAALYYVIGSVIYPISDYGVTGSGGASGDHPLIVTRDTPSLTELASIANESIDGNSGLWVVANDQIQATEDTVDVSIQIRALRGGLLDANGIEISTTARQKRGLVLSAGTQVRVFSNTDLRVVSTPGVVAQEARYPDLPFSGAVIFGESDPSLYNSYLERTATNAGGSNQYIQLPDLFTTNRPSWVTPGDVFVMRHTGSTTGTQRPHFRPDNTGDSIAGNGLRYWADPGQTIAVQAPPVGIRTWQLFPVSQRTDGVSYFNPQSVSNFFIDELDTVATRNPLSLYNRHEVGEGLVRDHIRTASFVADPISLSFQRKNFQDDIAWIEWWSVFAAVPPLGTIAEEILANIAASISYIETNINNGFTFDFNAPDATISIPAITNDGGNSYRIELASALPDWISVNDTITITGATNAGNNGDFIIDSIAMDRLLFNITNASGVNESGSGAFIQKTVYCTAVLVSHDLRQTNFNMFEDSGRTLPSPINPNWFDPSNEGADSVLAIGYNTDVFTVPPLVRMEDDNGDFFVSLGGPRGQVLYFDNAGGNYQNTRFLPINQEYIHIRTDGTADFYIDLHPDDLPVGQRRRIRLYSDPLNDNDDVDIFVGRPGGVVPFREGLNSLSLLNGTDQVVELYNDGVEGYVRIGEPFEKYIPSATLTNVVTPAAGPLAMSIAEIVVAESQDPNFSFYVITNNRIVCAGRFRYIFTFRVKLRFDGAEDTGISFVNAQLVPTRTRSAVTTDITRETGNSTVAIEFIRNGDETDDNTKPIYTLTGNLSYFAEPNDEIGWELRFGTFPLGYSVADLRQIERQYTITVKGGID